MTSRAPVRAAKANARLLCVALGILSPFLSFAVEEINVDVCVYGGTSGGIVAAVQSARMGKSVALVVVKNHLGGMTSGGLGATDIGRLGRDYIQGVAREFYTRVGAKYGSGSAAFAFEPHVAETVFNEMVQQAGVAVYTNQYLEAVLKEGAQIVAITMNNSNLFRAKVFIDASYEGDLMAKAGVSYTIGREAVAQYGESSNGIRPAPTAFGNLSVDPYLVPGTPASGLLPLLQPGELGTVGEADDRLQAFNYRMCLTTNATNRLTITAPQNYDPAQYELLGRYIQAMTAAGTTISLTTFMSIAVMPNAKTDLNNGGAISTDFVGESRGYPEASQAEREQIELAHQNYIKGLFYFLQTDARVPLAVRNQMQAYGYAKDEFVDSGGWPHQLYVREARRMVSDFVMTQAHLMSTAVAPDSIGLGAYTADQHSCGRLVIDGTAVKLPGGGGVPPKTYPVSYRSITPKAGECANLLVPWCLSVSHVVFCSLRMEPVFMILGQSAGTAAALAIDDDVSVQELSVPRLQAQLLADGQALGPDNLLNKGDNEVIVDNTDSDGVTIVGDWLASSSTPGYYGAGYLHDHNANKGLSSVTFIPTLPEADVYEVSARWTSYMNRSTNTPIDIISPAGTVTVVVDQTKQGAEWVSLLTTNFNAGTNGKVRIRNDGTTGYVIADAVRFRPVAYLPVVNLWATDASASRFGPHSGSFTVSRSGSPEDPLEIHLDISGDAGNGSDYETLPESITLPVGVTFTNISLRPLANSMPVGNRTVVLSLTSNAAYSVGPLASANLTIYDAPVNNWRLREFGLQATNAAIAGDAANPSGDGIPNFVKYALGLKPKETCNETLLLPHLDASGHFVFSFTRPDPPPIDVGYLADGSSAVAPWLSNSLPVIVGIALSSNHSTATITFRDESPSAAEPQGFRRLRVFRR